MALLGLDLDNLLGGITDLVDDLLGLGVGDIVDDLLPGDLLDDLGGGLDLLDGVAPTGLLEDLLDNDVLDLGLLQGILGGVTNGGLGGGALDLSSLDDLLSITDIANLEDILDDVFDGSGLLGLGETVLDLDALEGLGLLDLGSTTTFVTNLVGAIADLAGDTADVDLILDSLLAGDDKVDGTGGDDELAGRAGDDEVNGFNGNDTLSGGDGDDKLTGGAGDDILTGDKGDDQLFGNAGADRLSGGEGADKLTGGAGDDVYFVDNTGDVVVEAANGGEDSVSSSITYRLGAGVENLALAGIENINATGNGLANLLNGNDGNNTIVGGGGNDIIIGRDGKDVMAGGAGADSFRIALASDSAVGVGVRDIVTDYNIGDKFDFRAIDGNVDLAGDQAFIFRGASAFLDNDIGQVRVSRSASFMLITYDADGNGVADGQIQVTGLHNLTAADFVL